MKNLNLIFLSLLAVSVLLSCETTSEPDRDKETYSLFVTGIKESVTYEFASKNGRAESTPEEIKNLTLIILDQQNNVVFEQHYYNYDYGYETEGIPDTIYIPELPEGDYTIMASTSDYYYYYLDDAVNADGTIMGDSINFDETRFIIDSWLTSEAPIFVGYEEISLIEDGQLVQFDMENISAKVKVQLTGDQEARNYTYISFESSDNQSYALNTGEFFDNGDYGYFGTYLGPIYYWDYPGEGDHKDDNGNPDEYLEYLNHNSVFVLPRTIDKITIEVYNDFGFFVTTTVELEEGIRIEDGDMITFTLDLESMIGGSGAGSGVFSWEEINWNDLGEVSIP